MKDEDGYDIIPGAEPFYLKNKGQKVLLIHGFTATPTEMRPIGDYLHSKGYDIHSVLLAGHGTTPEHLQIKNKEDWWKSVVRAIEKIDGLDYVIGFSMGALLAARVAVEYSSKLKGVILISTFLKIKPKILSTVAFVFPLLKYIKPYFSKNLETERFFKDNNLISYMKYPMSAVHEAVKLSTFTKRKVLPLITIPTLVMQGEKDDRVDPENYKTILRLVPADRVELQLLPNSKHIVTVDVDKEILFDSIANFLEATKKL